jgi:hypothetical protein
MPHVVLVAPPADPRADGCSSTPPWLVPDLREVEQERGEGEQGRRRPSTQGLRRRSRSQKPQEPTATAALWRMRVLLGVIAGRLFLLSDGNPLPVSLAHMCYLHMQNRILAAVSLKQSFHFSGIPRCEHED